MNLIQQELLNHVDKHHGLTAWEIAQDIGKERGLGVLDVHNVLDSLEREGKVSESFEVNRGYTWWPSKGVQ